MRPWHFGNTTLRNPFRLREGLAVLAESKFLGEIKGRDQENAFARFLDEKGVVNITRPDQDASDLGRKWRSALTQLGFIVPELDGAGLDQTWIGKLFTLTPSGSRLITAETVPAIQECLLRSLAAYCIPSPLETGYHFGRFSPLRHTLQILVELDRQTGASRLNFIEMAVIVQLTTSADAIRDVVAKIVALRDARARAPNKRGFDNDQRIEAARVHDYAAGTFNDYADTNLRYLKATGLVRSAGRGIAIVPEKRLLVDQIIAQPYAPLDDQTYLVTLCQGAVLPTDNAVEARAVLDDLTVRARARGIAIPAPAAPLVTAADIAIARFEVEERLAEDKETEFARNQAAQWEEIAIYMDLIAKASNASVTHGDGEDAIEIKVPSPERPAYFEWVLWRAFLAINHLVNPPYKSRRFKIDQDFLPIGCAPGGGPDLIFEFDDFVIVGEVTLTQSSRQEAAEGEPVRRHVADIMMEHRATTGKPVYGLFVATKIDSNTAETFRIGVWYLGDDTKLRLDIVPVPLAQFRDYFMSLFRGGPINVNAIRTFLDDCCTSRVPAAEAPVWKRNIDTIVATHVGRA